MRVWIVFRGKYDDEYIAAVFSTLAKAEAFVQKKEMACLSRGKKFDWEEFYRVDGPEGIEIDELENETWNC